VVLTLRGERRGATTMGAAYTFTYTPGPLNSVGEITTYTLTAVPSDAGCTDWNRNFTEETGLIRWTHENRPATAQDPPISQ